MRIAIIGSPRAGKTTLATTLGAQLNIPVMSSDDLLWLGWSEASSEIADRMRARLAPCIYEGVAVVRALRKALLSLPAAASPVDRCIVLTRPLVTLTHGQEVMRRGCATIFAHVQGELESRGAQVDVDPPELVAQLRRVLA